MTTLEFTLDKILHRQVLYTIHGTLDMVCYTWDFRHETLCMRHYTTYEFIHETLDTTVYESNLRHETLHTRSYVRDLSHETMDGWMDGSMDT